MTNFTIAETKDKDGMTVGDLNQWVQLVMTLGVDPRTPVRVQVGFRSQILQIKPKGEPAKK